MCRVAYILLLSTELSNSIEGVLRLRIDILCLSRLFLKMKVPRGRWCGIVGLGKMTQLDRFLKCNEAHAYSCCWLKELGVGECSKNDGFSKMVESSFRCAASELATFEWL